MSVVFLEVSIGGKPCGKMVFRLYDNIVPRTALNFKCLCTGEMGMGKTTNKPLHYKNSIFHRVIPGFMCQGGDFSNRNGTGGESIFGGKFADERFSVKHDKPGLLSMANAGKDTNGSQFFVTFSPAPHLDSKHVVFGELVQGMDILQQIEGVDRDERDKPVFGNDVLVTDCGLYNPSEATKKKQGISSPVLGIQGGRERKADDSNSSTESDSSDSDRHRKKARTGKKDKKHKTESKKSKKSKSKKDKKGKKSSKKHHKKKHRRSYSSSSSSESEESYSGSESESGDDIKDKKAAQNSDEGETGANLKTTREALTAIAEGTSRANNSSGTAEKEKEKVSNSWVGADGITYKGRGRMKFRGGDTQDWNNRNGHSTYGAGGRQGGRRNGASSFGGRGDSYGREVDDRDRERGRERGRQKYIPVQRDYSRRGIDTDDNEAESGQRRSRSRSRSRSPSPQQVRHRGWNKRGNRNSYFLSSNTSVDNDNNNHNNNCGNSNRDRSRSRSRDHLQAEEEVVDPRKRHRYSDSE